MTRFRYRAADADGVVISGQIEAPNPAEARTLLRTRGLLPLSVGSGERIPIFPEMPSFRSKSKGLGMTDISVFTRQMATLITSGIQIEVALAAIAKQSGARLTMFCQGLRQNILDGANLSTALRAQTGGFDRYYLTSIEAGERSGRLGTVLERLSEHIEGRQRNRQTITLALIYPAILIIVSLAVVVALLVFVLPDIVRVFASRGAELPRLTQLMIGLSDLLTQHAAMILAGIGALIMGGYFLAQKEASRQAIDAALWRFSLTRQITLVQFTATLATLTQSGVVLADALGSATQTISNSAARAQLSDVLQEVRDGGALSQALARQQQFSPMMITMIASGEASGKLPQMLGRFAHDQSENLQAKVKTLVGLVEPLVLLGMGGVVMLLVLAILLPIVNLNSLVG
ncbi:MAG: type II secretion system F family protein [Pseudomonadota bacterium]